jgi:hypothetical protein
VRCNGEFFVSRALDPVTWQDWQAIDAGEIVAGEPRGRPGFKLVRRNECLDRVRGRDLGSSPATP